MSTSTPCWVVALPALVACAAALLVACGQPPAAPSSPPATDATATAPSTERAPAAHLAPPASSSASAPSIPSVLPRPATAASSSIDAVETKVFRRPVGVFASVVEEDGTTTTEPFPPGLPCSKGRGDARVRLSFTPTGGKQGTPRELGREGDPDVVKCLVLHGTRGVWKRTEPFVVEIASYESPAMVDTKK